MTLMNFEDLDTKPVVVPSITSTPVVTETVVIKPTIVAGGKDALSPVGTWTWEQVRDYVVRSIEARHGAFPRNFKTEASIFKSFVTRWGAQAGLIAKFAFEEQDGMWRNAPITVSRFTKNNDPYFASVIASRL